MSCKGFISTRNNYTSIINDVDEYIKNNKHEIDEKILKIRLIKKRQNDEAEKIRQERLSEWFSLKSEDRRAHGFPSDIPKRVCVISFIEKLKENLPDKYFIKNSHYGVTFSMNRFEDGDDMISFCHIRIKSEKHGCCVSSVFMFSMLDDMEHIREQIIKRYENISYQ
jgi:hypothetical protein